MYNPEVGNSQCGICFKKIGITHRHIKCSICQSKVHIKCNKTDPKTYEKLKNDINDSIICYKCREDNIPFFSCPENENKSLNKSNLLASESIKTFFKGINDLEIEQNDSDDEPPLNCKYYDLDTFKFNNNKKMMSFFHINIASLAKHKVELETLLSLLNFKFDLIGITETKILKDIAPIYDDSLEGFKHYFTPTESEKGGSSLYIAKHHNCKPRKDLDSLMYKSCELESTFAEIIIPKKKNIIIGCIYRHPSMDLDDFNESYLIPVLNKISEENKDVFLMGDFNADLMYTEADIHISNYFDTLTTHLLVPHIIFPTRVTPNSKTLIDNIFSNSLNYTQGISGNITSTISDHFAQFLIIPMDLNFIPRKTTQFKRNTKNFDKIFYWI